MDYWWSLRIYEIKQRVHSEMKQTILKLKLRSELLFYFYNFPLYLYSPSLAPAEPDTDEDVELLPLLPPAALALDDI